MNVSHIRKPRYDCPILHAMHGRKNGINVSLSRIKLGFITTKRILEDRTHPYTYTGTNKYETIAIYTLET